MAARAYELASKSGSESVGIVYFLMGWPDQTAEIQKSVKGAIAWFKKTKVTNLSFSSGVFAPTTNGALWYRFYEVDNDNHFFCDRAGISTKTQDFSKISEERRTGYQWAGNYGSTLIGMESAYLAAIATTSTRSVAHREGLQARLVPAGVSISVPHDGLFTVRFLDARGATLSRQELSSFDGSLVAALPQVSARGVSLVSVSLPGGASLGTVRIPAR